MQEGSCKDDPVSGCIELGWLAGDQETSRPSCGPFAHIIKLFFLAHLRLRVEPNKQQARAATHARSPWDSGVEGGGGTHVGQPILPFAPLSPESISR